AVSEERAESESESALESRGNQKCDVEGSKRDQRPAGQREISALKIETSCAGAVQRVTTTVVPMNEWRSAEHASAYLRRADRVPHRSAGEAALLEEIPLSAHRVLDLGSGDGRLLELVLRARPQARGVAVDFSPLMLEQLKARFGSAPTVDVVDHNLDDSLPFLGTFDVVVSSFAIHHLEHGRKRDLYEEIWAVLEPGGVFCNLEHVASASP